MKTQEETRELIEEIKYQGHNIAGTIEHVAHAVETLTNRLEKLTEQVNKIAERTAALILTCVDTGRKGVVCMVAGGMGRITRM